MNILKWLKNLFLGPQENDMAKTNKDVVAALSWAGQTKDFWLGKSNELAALGHSADAIREEGLKAGLSHAEIESIFAETKWPRKPFNGYNKADIVNTAQQHANNGMNRDQLAEAGRANQLTDAEIEEILAEVKFPAPPTPEPTPVATEKKTRAKKEAAPVKKKK